ncbi:hypothetical protein [Inquilinus sp. OTU3971]
MPEAVRVCLGGAANRAEMEHALAFMAHALAHSPAIAGGII